MKFWLHSVALCAAIAAVLLSGCSGSRAKVVARPGTTKTTEAAKPRHATLIDGERRVQSAAHFAAAVSYDLSGDTARALEEYILAADANPSFEPVVLEAARRLIRAQQTDKAIDLLSRAANEADVSGLVHAWLGMAYAQSGKPDLAIAANRAAIRKAPRSLAAYQNLAQVYLQTSRTNEALGVLDEAARQVPSDANFLIETAEMFSRFGRAQAFQSDVIKPRVTAALDQAARLDPTSLSTLLKLADGYLTVGELDRAEKVYVRILKQDPEFPTVREKLAEHYIRRGDKEKASEQLEAIARQNPTNPQAHLLLASLAVEDKKYDRAAEHLEKALFLSPDFEQAYYELAGLKITLNKPAEALEILERARNRFKVSFLLEFYTGVAHGMSKDYPVAVKYYTAAEIIAKASEPQRLTHQFYYQFGSAYERSGDIDTAAKQFERAIEIAPKYADAMNYLGYMWAERGMNLERAHDLIQQAVTLEPKNAAFLDSLAWVLFKLNKPNEALNPMLKAIEHSEEPDATLYDHLGDIYSALGQFGPAAEAWKKSLTIEPNDQAEQIKKKLGSVPAVSSAAP